MVNSQHDGVTERESLRRSGAGQDDVQAGDERRLFDIGSSAERQFPFLRERLSRRKVDLRRSESFAPELVRFRPPAILSSEHSEFVVNIVVLDHRSLHAFGAHSKVRAEVKALLQSAVATAGYHPVGIEDSRPHGDGGDLLPATGLYRQAEEVFLRHLQARNRLRYLLGVTLGILVLVAVAFAVKAKLLPDALEDAIPLKYLPAIIFFAGLGSIVSVLLRLSKLDVMSESARVLVISGTGRLLVASAFALVVSVAIHSKVVAVPITDGDKIGSYLVVAFLCGFSERFAKDLLERVEQTPRDSQRSEQAR